MSKNQPTEGPATEAFLAGLSPSERATRTVLLELAPEELATLPSRLRALVADEETITWQAAKAARDAALAAAMERVDPEDPDSAFVIEDPEERAALVEAAKSEWAAFKAPAAGS